VLLLIVGGVPGNAIEGGDGDKKARIGEIEQRINMILATLRAYRAANKPDAQKDEATKAAQELREARESLESLKNESRQEVSNARHESDQWLAALKQRCRAVSALIYLPVLRPAGPAPAADARSSPVSQTGRPAVPASRAVSETRPPETPPNRGPSDAGSPPAVDGAFHYEARVLTTLRAPLMATVKFVVIGAGGKKLPSELRQSVIVGSLLFEKNKEGTIRLFETPQIQTQEAGTPMTNLIYQGAVSLRPQIRFFRRPADRFQTKLELVAVSTGQPIEPVEQDREYTVRFEISAGGLEKLQGLLEGH
jgi:hypothetical protein